MKQTIRFLASIVFVTSACILIRRGLSDGVVRDMTLLVQGTLVGIICWVAAGEAK